MGQHPQQHIHNVAASVAAQAKIEVGVFEQLDFLAHDLPTFANDLWRDYGSKVLAIVGRMGPPARGRIAACGVGLGSPTTGATRHWDVNQGKMLNEAYSGQEILTLLASYVLIAAIADNLYPKADRARQIEERHWQFMEEFR